MCILLWIILIASYTGLVGLGVWSWKAQTELLNEGKSKETKPKDTCIKSENTTTRVGCARCSGVAFKPVQVSESSQMIYYDNLCKKCIKKWEKR